MIAEVEGDVEVDTGSGSVLLSVPPQLGAEVEIDVGSGGIDFDLPVQVVEMKRTYFRGRIGDGDGRIDIDTGSGGVKLRQG